MHMIFIYVLIQVERNSPIFSLQQDVKMADLPLLLSWRWVFDSWVLVTPTAKVVHLTDWTYLQRLVCARRRCFSGANTIFSIARILIRSLRLRGRFDHGDPFGPLEIWNWSLGWRHSVRVYRLWRGDSFRVRLYSSIDLGMCCGGDESMCKCHEASCNKGSRKLRYIPLQSQQRQEHCHYTLLSFTFPREGQCVGSLRVKRVVQGWERSSRG